MAEVDYLVAGGNNVIPVEVKSGTTGQMKSLRLFLDARKTVAPCGVRFSLHNFSRQPDLHSYPLYAVIAFAAAHNPGVREAVRMLANG